MISAPGLVAGTPSGALGPAEVLDREVLCNRFGEEVRRLRLEAALSMDALGERSGLHRTEISLLERAGREPKLSTIVRVADGLRVAPGYLLDEVVVPRRKG